MQALLIDPGSAGRVSAREQLDALLDACAPAAEHLGCEAELEDARRLAAANGAARQLVPARGGDLRDVTAALARAYV
jgi:gamma-glutamyl:cysteine ligase YbdK (ATP-grasp superfamily)